MAQRGALQLHGQTRARRARIRFSSYASSDVSAPAVRPPLLHCITPTASYPVSRSLPLYAPRLYNTPNRIARVVSASSWSFVRRSPRWSVGARVTSHVNDVTGDVHTCSSSSSSICDVIQLRSTDSRVT